MKFVAKLDRRAIFAISALSVAFFRAHGDRGFHDIPQRDCRSTHLLWLCF